MLNATELSNSIGTNQNLSLPEFPVLVPDLVLIRHSERALVVLGGNVPRLLEGRSVALIADRLFPLLDGRHHRDAICQGVRGFPAASARDALYFLYAEGLLVEGDGRRRSAGTRASAFYDRYCAIKRNQGNGGQVVERLARTRVGVLSDDRYAAMACALVAAAGIGEVRALDIQGFLDFDGSPVAISAMRAGGVDSLGLIVLVTPGFRDVDAQALVRACRASGKPVLLIDPVNPSIGPLVSPQTAACLACSLAQRGGPAEPMSLAEHERDHAWALMSCRISCFLGDVVDTPIEDSVLHYRASDMSWHGNPVHRLVDCRECAAPILRAAPESWALARPENSSRQLVAFFHINTQERATQAARSSHLLSYSSGVRDSVAGAFKAYPRSVTLRLPVMAQSPSELTGDFAARLGTTLVAAVSWTAKLGDGMGEMRVRALPSAGNLASQSLYLVSGGTAGLPRGAYYCHPDGSLRLLDAAVHPADVDATCGFRSGHDGNARAYLIATAAVARLESKYRDKAYRFAFQDAGVLLAGLLELANQTGLEIQSTGDFLDDRVGALLGICAVSEIVTFVVQVSTAHAHQTPENHGE